MAPSRCRRVCQQTWALTVKNSLIFSKSPLASLFRALLLPVAITVVLCFLKYIKTTDNDRTGISYYGAPVLELPAAISASPSNRLVISLNGIEDQTLNDTIHAIRDESSMSQFDIQIIDEPNALYDVCRQSIQGTSECFAAVIFTAFDENNAEYIMALDDHVVSHGPASYKTRHSILSDRLLPLQWAIDSHLGNFTDAQRPTEKMWHGIFDQTPYDDTAPEPSRESRYWLELVMSFAAPLFTLILIPLAYHVSMAVANERQTGLAELMMAQGVTVTPRVLSNFLSFFAFYIPGAIASSILLGEVLFVETSTGLVFILELLALLAFLAWSHVIGSLFARAQLAGLCGSVLTFVMGLVIIPVILLSRTLSPTYALSLLFPPYAWVSLIKDVARAEAMGRAFPDAQVARYSDNINGNLYFVFFIVQIVLYVAGVYAIECWRWGLPNEREWIDRAQDVALRLSHLSKTFSSKSAVDDLSLDVQKGSVTFLLGPNGCGKTTVLNCISRMMRVDKGSSVQFNRDSYSFGLCPQSNILWDSLTVKEHIRIWGKLKTAGLSITEVDDVLTECDLTRKTNAASETLSGGQKRKLQLAIAFAGGSKVCCIDEATSGLDPLSRRNIWNIIQQGRRQRTTILTTHFLDEADVLADHIVIMCKGRLVCQGTSVVLKTQYGDGYRISTESGQVDDASITLKAASSAEATNKVLELERSGFNSTCSIAFPTLEQVFLKATSEFNTVVQQTGGDGMVGDEEPDPESFDAFEDKIAFEDEYQGDHELDLDMGRSIGILRQIAVLFQKRYMLLLQPSNWIAYLINLAIPIIVTGALSKYLYTWQPLTTCDAQYNSFMDSSGLSIPPLENHWSPVDPDPGSVIGPKAKMTGPVQDALYADSLTWIYELEVGHPSAEVAANMALTSRQFVDGQHEFEVAMNESSGLGGFGLYETPETAIFFHNTMAQDTGFGLAGFSFLTNRIANSTSTTNARQVTTSMRVMRHVQPSHGSFDLPMIVLVVIAFVAAVSAAAIYPIYERISNVRALQYSNGVSPSALWTAYLLFDMQFIFIETFIAWGVLMARPIHHVWYRPDCIFGAFVLFGIASYLGTYLLSNVIRKAGYAAALGIHLLFLVLYFVAYVINQFAGSAYIRQETYNALQDGLGLIAPSANLARALFLGMNTFDILCGKYGDADTSYPFAYSRYGGVYANLVYQILFLIAMLGLCEYGSREWFRRLLWWRRRAPARLHHNVAEGDEPGPRSFSDNIQLAPPKSFADSAATNPDPTILEVNQVSKYFGSSFAAQNISLQIPANETLALLGANGAGKTTIINMIRGELKPEFGDIYVDGVSVVRQPSRARLQIGVCPQDDAVDNLTVRQTLHFYATVKGVKSITKNVQQVLDALDVAQFANVKARKLSGGTKRKLTVAIALLGNPRLLLLDEPSTNQDAGAKRILWRALQRIGTNRAILLTTHSMEEAEALASRVAIIRTRLLAMDTLSSLNISYGGSYRLRAVRSRVGVSVDYAKEAVQNTFSHAGCQVTNYADMNGLVQFFVNYDRALLPTILVAMERLKIGSPFGVDPSGMESASSTGGWDQARVFEDYTLIEPTLEEVFMNVSREAEGL